MGNKEELITLWERVKLHVKDFDKIQNNNKPSGLCTVINNLKELDGKRKLIRDDLEYCNNNHILFRKYKMIGTVFFWRRYDWVKRKEFIDERINDLKSELELIKGFSL